MVHFGRRAIGLGIKRALDIVAATMGLILPIPLWALVALAIRLDSPGPVFFKQLRAGLGGRPFSIWKFRTMYADTPPTLNSPNTRDDPRITRVGRWLRETSIDEIPQLLNVLRGEMSLVGPRPVFVEHIAGYTDEQKTRFRMRPGITGLAQVMGRARMTWPERLVLDVQYVDAWRLGLDLRILVKTVRIILNRDSTYEIENPLATPDGT
jgi:lipopolysaccharide/colanic/teichoic acid biosynthesis glycosyltransferase